MQSRKCWTKFRFTKTLIMFTNYSSVCNLASDWTCQQTYCYACRPRYSSDACIIFRRNFIFKKTFLTISYLTSTRYVFRHRGPNQKFMMLLRGLYNYKYTTKANSLLRTYTIIDQTKLRKLGLGFLICMLWQWTLHIYIAQNGIICALWAYVDCSI